MKKFLLVIAIAIIAAIIYKSSGAGFFKHAAALHAESSNDLRQNVPDGVRIKNTWELPDELIEVSGIAYLDAERFLCVQDEKGVIFIFNRKSGKIEREITFAERGDFEGLTIAGNTAWVVRSDGALYAVNMSSEKTTEYSTAIRTAVNIEGLCYDAKNDRLLLAGKDEDNDFTGFKSIFAFDLRQKKMLEKPAFQIDLSNPAFISSGKKKSKALRPSAIGIEPKSNNIFITDGPSANLLQLGSNGSVKKLYKLGKSFYQPEGISFSPEGKMFISNEGGSKPANIIEVEL